MSMRFCPNCGVGHECDAGDVERERVAIVRLETQRDIEVARINASAAKVISATEAEHSADFAEGKAEGLEEAIAGPEEPVAEGGEPIVVEVPTEPEAEVMDDVVEEPPVITTPTPSAPKRGGYWANYS